MQLIFQLGRGLVGVAVALIAVASLATAQAKPGPTAAEQQLAKLRKEVADLHQENASLKAKSVN
jgi:cell division protein FtsB